MRTSRKEHSSRTSSARGDWRVESVKANSARGLDRSYMIAFYRDNGPAIRASGSSLSVVDSRMYRCVDSNLAILQSHVM